MRRPLSFELGRGIARWSATSGACASWSMTDRCHPSDRVGRRRRTHIDRHKFQTVPCGALRSPCWASTMTRPRHKMLTGRLNRWRRADQNSDRMMTRSSRCPSTHEAGSIDRKQTHMVSSRKTEQSKALTLCPDHAPDGNTWNGLGTCLSRSPGVDAKIDPNGAIGFGSWRGTE